MVGIKIKNIKENAWRMFFLMCALACVAAVAAICVFIFANAVPVFGKIGIFKFLLGERWKPSNNEFGIFPMIAGSIYVTGGAVLIGVPLGIFTAVFISIYCHGIIAKCVKFTIDLLAGIPSLVYGLFGLTVAVPLIGSLFGTSGKGILTASVVLAIMILPTVTGICESSVSAVPKGYMEGSLALGATREVSVFKVVLPAAASGVLSAAVLGIGRAVGETMAVVMIAGNSAVMPASLLSSVRTLTANIVLEMSYASNLHREALIATAAVLFVFIIIINFCIAAMKRNKF